MKVKARLLCRKGKTTGTIQLVAYFKDQQKEVSLGRTLEKHHWDSKKGVAKGRENQLLNIQIRNAIRDVSDAIDECIVLKKDVDLNEIFKKTFQQVPEVQSEEKQITSLVEFVNDFIMQNPDKISQSSMNNYRSMLRSLKLFDPTGTDLLDVNVEFVNRYYAYLKGEGLEPTTIRSRFMKLKKIINTAIVRGMIKEYPFGKGKLMVPNPRNSKPKYLTDSEVDRILNYTPQSIIEEKVLHIVKFNLHVGLRIGDVFTLRKKHILLKEDPVHGRQFKLSKTASKTDTDIHISLTKQASEQIVQNGYDVKNDDDFIFPWIKPGGYQDSYSLYKEITSKTAYFNKVLAEICIKVGIKKISSHSLRHTFCTTLISKGVPVTSIAKLVGHADISTTMIYAQILQKAADEAIQVLED